LPEFTGQSEVLCALLSANWQAAKRPFSRGPARYRNGAVDLGFRETASFIASARSPKTSAARDAPNGR
jgi:hypothetical protein